MKGEEEQAEQISDLEMVDSLWPLTKAFGFGDFNNRLNRLKMFFEAYGASREEMIASVKLLPRRLLSLLDWIYKEAAAGNEGCKRNLQDKYHELYLRDIRALTTLHEAI